MAKNKIYIPTFISSIDYKPARVLPHIYFYNGTLLSDSYYIESFDATGSIQYNSMTKFPYFDNYEGNLPSTGSRSLLFFNEPAPYGETPTDSLYSDYWQTYVELLYNPKTRLFDCSAIIPLADYFKMELNDICEWRGNYYHLRAINDYNLSNGECQLQLLGPIISDAIENFLFPCNFDYNVATYIPGTTTTTTAGPTTTTTTTTSTTTTTAAPTTTTTTAAPITTTTTLPSGLVTNGLVVWNNYQTTPTGSIWLDSSGNGNTALISGSALALSGSVGYWFNGTNNFLTYREPLVGQPSSSWTMQFTLTPYDNTNNLFLAGKKDYADGWDTIVKPSTGTYNSIYIFRDIPGADWNIYLPNAFTSSINVTMTINTDGGAYGLGQGEFYVNGVFGTSVSFSPGINPFDVNSEPFRFGYKADVDAEYYNGGVKQILLYNRVLTSSEILQNYNYLNSL